MKNEYSIIGDVCKIKLNRRKSPPLYAIIDAEDFILVDNYIGTWYASYDKGTDSYYVRGNLDGKTIRLHRFILGITDSSVKVDHKDHDTLNNRRSNLKAGSHADNMANRRVNANSKTGVPGVYVLGRNYGAQYSNNGNNEYLGTYKTIDEAAKAVENRRLQDGRKK